MADYTLGVYDFDPYFTFSRTVGGEIVYAGPANSETTAVITDNGVGADGDTITDSSENATGTITINGNTSTGVSISAEESWTLLDVDTGETFQIITFEIESGPAAGYYTISEKPLVPGHTYRTTEFNTDPTSSDSTFSYDDYVTDIPDGTVDGTTGDDTIDGSYAGDPQGELVDANDSIGNPAVKLDLNWDAAGADEADLFGGVSQNTGGIQVDVSFTDDGNGTEWSVESSQTQYVGAGETFDTQSSLLLYGNGAVGDTSTTRVDFSSVGGSGFQDEVTDVQFRINDIDSATGGFQDVFTVRAFDADGVEVDVDFTIGGDETLAGNTISGGANANSEADLDGSVLITISGPVSYFTIDYDQGGSGNQAVYVTDIEFNALPVGGNSDVIDAGAGNDSIDSGDDTDTVFGGTGNDTIAASEDDDTLFGGDDADTFIMGDGQGDDSIVGGEGGTDSDTIDASALTAGVDVTFTGNEAGTIDGTGTDATFSEIETLILTDLADTVDGSASSSSMTITAGDGADSIIGSSAADTLSGGDGNDTLAGGGGADSITGGAGLDYVDYSASSSGVTVNLTTNTGSGGDAAGDTFAGVDGIIGSGFADTLTGYNAQGVDFTNVIYGGAGADVINGLDGDDTLFGGDDADTFLLQDNFGNDTIEGGEGGTDADEIDASAVTSGVTVDFTGGETGTLTDGTDTLSFDEIESFVLTGQADTVNGSLSTSSMTIDAGAGDDTITGGTGDDTLYAGADDDTITGGDGNDTIFGGAGSDTITLADGDSASGGDGDDTFIINQTDAGTGGINITGGEGNETSGDTLDFNGQLDKGTMVITDSDDANGGLTGFAFLLDGTRVDFTEIETIICFARGTSILTHTGEKLFEDLSEGDQILTHDNGLQQIRWIGSRTVPAKDDLAPITIAENVLGNHSDLTVSPQHRMLVSGAMAELLFGETEVLVPAKHLLSWDGVYCAQMDEVEYFHILFDTHQIIHANGALSESFHPGEQALDAVTQDARDEILTLFPELANEPSTYGPAARISLKGYEAEVLGRGMA